MTRPEGRAPTHRSVLGRAAEDLAARHLASQGATLLLRNFRRRTGELDIVALHADVLLVVEVRLRSREDYGGGAASVEAHKQRRIIRTAQQLLQSRRDLARWPMRFDVVVVTPGTAGGGAADGAADADSAAWRLEWIRHAFSAAG